MQRIFLFLLLLSCLSGINIRVIAQALDPADTLMSFEEYQPISTLVVPEHPITRAKYPFIDVHSHQYRMDERDLEPLVAEMDSLNIGAMVNLSGRGWSRSPDYLENSIKNIDKQAPGRIVTFTNIRFDGIDDPNWQKLTLAQLERDVKDGANGLKIFKNLGLSTKDSKGNRIAVDDPRLDPIWAKCGELGVPVLIHTGEPAAFWKPRDKNNERWLELKQKPRRYRDPKTNPSWEELMGEQHNIFRKHPNTIFINAHLGWLGNDLERLGKLLDELPNMYTEIGAVLAELGRQPRNARAFFLKYQDRIMFGKDSYRPNEFPYYFRVLETDDEYFDYYRKRHAHWKMYGLNLPDEVLKKLYYKNAIKVIPGFDASQFPE
ncbi:MAG: amidohydrolase family protein [Bacteroidota bacterium]